MGLRRALGGLPGTFGVLREPCGACFGHRLGLKVGPRRFRFYKALCVSVEAGRRRMLGFEKWNAFAALPASDGSRFPARTRELSCREDQVGLRPHSQACMWSYWKSSVAVVGERPRVGLCNGVFA